MIRFILAVLFSLTMFASMAKAEKVRFATFNAFWLYDDKPPLKRWSDRRQQANYLESIKTVGRAIKSLKADVVALQEIEGENVLKDLVDFLKTEGVDYPYYWSSSTLDPVTGQNIGVLSKFPNVIEPVRRYPGKISDYLSDKGFARIAGIPKILRVDLEIKNQTVTIFATHLKSQRGGDTADNERLAQAKILRRIVRVRSEKGNKRNPSFVMVMGDLNDLRGSATLGILRGLGDSSYRFFQTSDKLPETERWTYIFENKKQQLDHILLNKFLWDRVSNVEAVRFDKTVSDHDALVVEVNIDE